MGHRCGLQTGGRGQQVPPRFRALGLEPPLRPPSPPCASVYLSVPPEGIMLLRMHDYTGETPQRSAWPVGRAVYIQAVTLAVLRPKSGHFQPFITERVTFRAFTSPFCHCVIDMEKSCALTQGGWALSPWRQPGPPKTPESSLPRFLPRLLGSPGSAWPLQATCPASTCGQSPPPGWDNPSPAS